MVINVCRKLHWPGKEVGQISKGTGLFQLYTVVQEHVPGPGESVGRSGKQIPNESAKR